MKKKKAETNSTPNTISEAHIEECICLVSDKGKPIDEVVDHLKNAKIDPPFSMK